jgi:hypothetical protein
LTRLLELLFLLACSFLGFALIALTQNQHRKRVAEALALQRRAAMWQRAAGVSLLIASLPIALWRETGGGFGSILWVLSLTVGALLVAAGLTWRPRIFRVLVQRR